MITNDPSHRAGSLYQPRILDIALLGNPILRQIAKPVEDCMEPGIQALIDDMVATMCYRKTMGLSAPQVFRSLRIITIASRPTENYPDAPTIHPFVIINPIVESRSLGNESGWEGCASIPGIRGKVSRSVGLTISFLDRDVRRNEMEMTGFVARIFQHEFDHLNGVVFLDNHPTSLIMESELIRQRYQKSK